MKKDGFSEIYDIYFPKLLRFTRTYLISEDESRILSKKSLFICGNTEISLRLFRI